MTDLKVCSGVPAYPEYRAPVNDDSAVAPRELQVCGVGQCRVHQPRVLLEQCHGVWPSGELRVAGTQLVVRQTFEPGTQTQAPSGSVIGQADFDVIIRQCVASDGNLTCAILLF